MWIHANEEIARNLQEKFVESSLADQDLLGVLWVICLLSRDSSRDLEGVRCRTPP